MATRKDSGAWLGLFVEPDALIVALDDLRAAGFSGPDLNVLSGTPYPSGTFGEEERPHHLFAFAFGGAGLGFLVGLLVTIGMQISYPMVTGGKPVLSIPPMLNVIYEGTLLGAIVFTFVGALLESRLPRFGSRPYDARVTQGYLGLHVRYDAHEAAGVAERVLRSAGAIELVRSPSP
jgi:hypothetical protein